MTGYLLIAIILIQLGSFLFNYKVPARLILAYMATGQERVVDTKEKSKKKRKPDGMERRWNGITRLSVAVLSLLLKLSNPKQLKGGLKLLLKTAQFLQTKNN